MQTTAFKRSVMTPYLGYDKQGICDNHQGQSWLGAKNMERLGGSSNLALKSCGEGSKGVTGRDWVSSVRPTTQCRKYALNSTQASIDSHLLHGSHLQKGGLWYVRVKPA